VVKCCYFLDCRLFEYLSGEALRSWCVIDFNGRQLEAWQSVLPQDAEAIRAYSLG
jgi:hypothetical protein